MTTDIFFDPAVGKNYGTGLSIFRKKILILGASHYCVKPCEDCGNRELHNCSEVTLDAVDAYLRGTVQTDWKNWKKTYSTFINSMFGRSTSNEERADFFDSVIFYNYLQTAEPVDPSSIHRKYDFADSRHLRAFYEIIEINTSQMLSFLGDPASGMRYPTAGTITVKPKRVRPSVLTIIPIGHSGNTLSIPIITTRKYCWSGLITLQ